MDLAKMYTGTRAGTRKSILIYKAIMENNINQLDVLLCKPDVDINSQTLQGETYLFLSIKRKCSEELSKRLIQAGCDVNIPSNEKVTPLYLAILSSSLSVADELIKKGADLNVQEERMIRTIFSEDICDIAECCNRNTPLHFAVRSNNLKAVCLLLYYGANVYLTNSEYISPLKYAVFDKSTEIIKILIDHYDQSYYAQPPVQNYSPRPFALHVECEITILLLNSFDCNNSTMFKIIWSKVNPGNYLTSLESYSLLASYITNSNFPTSDWLECLNVILELLIANQFTCEYGEDFFRDLFVAFYRKNIEAKDRLFIINICLSVGACVTPDDHEYAYQLYGFNKELEALIYGANRRENAYELCTITSFILAEEKHFDSNALSSLFEEYLQEIQFGLPADYFINLLGFFSLPSDVKGKIKKSLMGCSKNVQQEVLSKLEKIPEFPSLFELARNQARLYIKKFYNITYSYQFHDIVRKLNFPKVIQDVIRFKTSLY